MTGPGNGARRSGEGEPAGGYSSWMRALHWATALLLGGSYAAAWAIGSASTSQEAARAVMLHRSIGLAILVLTLLRLVCRQRTEIPPLPSDLPAAQRVAARSALVAMYGLLLLQPLVGLTASMLHGDRIVLVGDLTLPSLLPVSRSLARQLFELHGWTALALLTVIAMHVAAALYHHFVRRDAVLAGMVPGLRPPAGRLRARSVRFGSAEPER